MSGLRQFRASLRIGAFLGVLLFPGGRADAESAPPPQVVAIYPTARVLPANHLKFYLHFSEPMRQGVFMDYCTLLDDHDRPIMEPFRETELWNETGDRLTLWLHPGRQKTGVNLNEEFGPVLRPGKRYRLVIAGKWPSANGVLLGKDVEKSFFTMERATQQLDIGAWKISPPSAGLRAPLEVIFPAPLDHSLLMRCLQVTLDGRKVEGAASTFQNETGWRFVPDQSWEPGAYEIVADAILEDLAGNSLARPFEVDLTGPPPRKTPASVRRAFQVGRRE